MNLVQVDGRGRPVGQPDAEPVVRRVATVIIPLTPKAKNAQPCARASSGPRAARCDSMVEVDRQSLLLAASAAGPGGCVFPADLVATTQRLTRLLKWAKTDGRLEVFRAWRPGVRQWGRKPVAVRAVETVEREAKVKHEG